MENYQIYFFVGQRWPQSLIGRESREKETVSYIANQCPKNSIKFFFKNRLTVLVSVKITFVQNSIEFVQYLCSKQLEKRGYYENSTYSKIANFFSQKMQHIIVKDDIKQKFAFQVCSKFSYKFYQMLTIDSFIQPTSPNMWNVLSNKLINKFSQLEVHPEAASHCNV